jgi:hypothetical protein
VLSDSDWGPLFAEASNPDKGSQAFCWAQCWQWLSHCRFKTSASMANTPESFIQAIIHYRQKFKDGITNDKIYSVLIHSNKDKYTEFFEGIDTIPEEAVAPSKYSDSNLCPVTPKIKAFFFINIQ